MRCMRCGGLVVYEQEVAAPKGVPDEVCLSCGSRVVEAVIRYAERREDLEQEKPERTNIAKARIRSN